MKNVLEIITAQRCFWNSGKTRSINYRRQALERLEKAVIDMEGDFMDALHKDLNKSAYESYASEIGMVLAELRFAKKHLSRWTACQRKPSVMPLFPAKCWIQPEPYGVVLIMSPWNYPVQLTLVPLISAIAAGNCVVIKPSEHSSACSKVLHKLIEKTFPPQYITLIEGGMEVNKELLSQHFDYIFFTGSTQVGRIVMEAAAQNLTPVTLELGGKSPVIIVPGSNLKLAARRIVWGKFLNAGQTCVAPDHVWVPEELRDTLVEEIKFQIADLYGVSPLESPDLPKIINESHFQRVISLIDTGKTVIGGKTDPCRLMIEPTVMINVTEQDPVMKEEIFGPILPVLTYHNLDKLLVSLQKNPRPLALYIFADNPATEEKIIKALPSGGVCINDTIAHLANPNLPFGGIGSSGMGSCHGRHGFDTFTHNRTVVRRGSLDIAVRYAPYAKKSLQKLKKLI